MAPEPDGRWEGLGLAHLAFDLCHHFRRMPGRAHPAQAGDSPLGIDVDLEHAHGVELGLGSCD